LKNSLSERKVIVVFGATASGKTDTCVSIAKFINSEIISADSRQFYREMNIGTAKPSSDQLSQVKHHFVGFLSIHDNYNVTDFERDGLRVIEIMHSNSKVPLITGGSGLFIDALIKGFNKIPDYDPLVRKTITDEFHSKGLNPLLDKLRMVDPESYLRIDKKNFRRILRALEVSLSSGIPYSHFIENVIPERNFRIHKIGLNVHKDVLYQKINMRCEMMLQNGLLDEVTSLFDYRHLPALQTIGYKEFFEFIEGKCSLDFAIGKFMQHTRNYAKKQLTWLRKDKDIIWIDQENHHTIYNSINNFLEKNQF